MSVKKMANVIRTDEFGFTLPQLKDKLVFANRLKIYMQENAFNHFSRTSQEGSLSAGDRRDVGTVALYVAEQVMTLEWEIVALKTQINTMESAEKLLVQAGVPLSKYNIIML